MGPEIRRIDTSGSVPVFPGQPIEGEFPITEDGGDPPKELAEAISEIDLVFDGAANDLRRDLEMKIEALRSKHLPKEIEAKSEAVFMDLYNKDLEELYKKRDAAVLAEKEKYSS